METATFHTPYAGFVSRASAFLIDIAVMIAALMLIVAVAQSVLGFFTLYGLLGQRVVNSPLFQQVVDIVVTCLCALVAIGYPVGFWVLRGHTPGMALMGVRLWIAGGKPITLRRALLRYLGYWLSAIPLGLGFFWVLADDQRQGWHDKLAGTHVIYEPVRAVHARKLPA